MKMLADHLAIAASAGSGKTFRLAHRYIRLLALGVEPSRIAALTFSRKAAGEIFDSIVGYLVAGAASEDDAAALAGNIGIDHLAPAQCVDLLRILFASLHRLKVGTLDGFAVGLVRTFAVELGVGPEPVLYDTQGGEGITVRREVLDRVFRHGSLPASALNDFIDAFRQATFGREERRLFDLLDTFVTDFHELFLLARRQEDWGNPERLWPRSRPGRDVFWREVSPLTDECCERLTALAEESFVASVAVRWHDFVAAARTFNPAAPLARPVSYFFEKVGPVLADLAGGEATLRMGRSTVCVSGECAALTRSLMGQVMRAEYEACCRKASGIHRVLSLYEELYDRYVRRRGKLTFTDVQHLLGPLNPYAPGRCLAGEAAKAGELRLAIDYRLDGRLDHWLLDEFQDTSTLQWKVLENLIDEVVQDDSGERSFFYVGDVKQAIYGWRNGNAALFDEIRAYYQGAIRQEPLDLSYRSRPAVIDLVNQVFDTLPDELPVATVNAWSQIWRPHASAPHLVAKPGYAVIVEPEGREGGKPDGMDRHLLTAAILREVSPITHQKSVAVLVRSNRQGRDLVEVLRGECPGLAVIHEGVSRIDDTPVVSVLLAVLRFAAHPGDTFAARQIEMSPLAPDIATHGPERARFCRRLLASVQERGFRDTVARWGARLDRRSTLDAFGVKRLDDLCEAAGRFDTTGSREINGFLRFIANYNRKEEAAAGVVRVMTVHQSKGLGFDVVLLPELQNKAMATATGDDLLAVPTDSGPVNLAMPRKSIAQADPTLAGAIAGMEAIAGFDELCVLYVALTRAKQAVYCITSDQGKSSTSLMAATLVKMQTTGERQPQPREERFFAGVRGDILFETGDPAWWQEMPEAVPAQSACEDNAPSRPATALLGGRLRQVTPSAAADHIRPAAALFAPPAGHGMAFGSAVHALFEDFAWLGETDPERVVEKYLRKAELPPDLAGLAADQFRTALDSHQIRAVMRRPAGDVTLWRERSFDVVVNGEWVSGVFDRVVLEHDAQGGVRRATVLDYKSNRLTEEELALAAASYRPQMLLYRQALSILCGVDGTAVELLLLFTSLGRVVRVDG